MATLSLPPATDQHHSVLWTEGFSVRTRLLCSSPTFALNSSRSSALSAYSSSDTLHALTLLLPLRSQPPSSTTTASKMLRPTALLQPHFCTLGRRAPEHCSSVEDASDAPSLPPSYECNQSTFSSFHVLPRSVLQPSHTTPHCPMSATPPSPCAGYVHMWRHRWVFGSPKS